MRSGVAVEEMTIGTGTLAARGTIVTIHYRGFLTRGDQFRSSYDDGRPLRVHLGSREVMAGLEHGLLGMRVGGRRRLKFVHERTATAKLTTTRSRCAPQDMRG
jgi:FKBP-type peptidyl-prolyl cis-trans isomerase